MNSDVALLVFQYKRGAITADQFSNEMRQMNYSLPQIMQIIADVNNPRVREPNIPSPDGTGPVATSTQPRPQPASASTQGQGSSVPYYGMDDMPVGSASNMPVQMQEDRLSRARLSDLPSDFGSPAGSMAYPSSLPPSLTPSTVQRAIDVAKTRQPAPQTASQTASEPSALASLIRGRFGEAGKGSPFEDRLTAAQEARDRMGESRASGGEVAGKSGNSRDAALHKALEIIHYMLTNR